MSFLQNSQQSIFFQFFKTAIIALIGGMTANLVNLPVPWLLGPMLAVMICSSFLKVKLKWTREIRDAGTMIVGYAIGLSFTKAALILIVQQLPMMILMTVLLTIFCFGFAYIVSKISKIDYPSVLVGSTPGGLTQMILLAEELKGINVSVVTFFQVSRLMIIVIFVPLLVFSPLVGVDESTISSVIHSSDVKMMELFPEILIFIPVVILSSLLFRKLRIPTPFLVGPIFGTALICQLGIEGPALPSVILDLSQFMVGTYLGLLIKFEKIENKTKTTVLSLLEGFLLLLGSWGLSSFLTHEEHISAATGILSLAPGGMDQMGIIATEINADLSMVAGFQLFRLFFIFFIIPPILKFIIYHILAKKYESLIN
jgi:membrane AbrB-like protein